MSLASGVGVDPSDNLFFLLLEHIPSIAEPWWGVQGTKSLEASKNLHPRVPKTGSKIGPKHVDGCAFFQVHCSTKSQENSRRSKILNSQVSYQKKMRMLIFLAGQYFANFKSKQRVTYQCQDRPYTLQHLSNFSTKNFLYNFMAIVSVRTLFNVS